MTATRIVCSECGDGYYVLGSEIYNDAYATCTQCGHEVHVVRDIEPHLEEGERVETWAEGYLMLVAQDA